MRSAARATSRLSPKNPKCWLREMTEGFTMHGLWREVVVTTRATAPKNRQLRLRHNSAADAHTAKVLTTDEARPIAANIAE